MIRFALLLIAYTFVALTMCAFIMANENSESFGSPSPISDVKSTQRGSIVEYIIWGLAILFLILCIFLNRASKPNVISKLLTETAEEHKVPEVATHQPHVVTENLPKSEAPDENRPATSEAHDITGSIIKPIIENARIS